MITRHLLPLLRHLELPALRYATFLEELGPVSGEPSSGTDLEPSFFLNCPNLRDLNMLCCRLRIPQAYAPLSSLRRLEITGRSPPLHYEDILAILNMIPRICALNVACDMDGDDDYDPEWNPGPDRTHFLPPGTNVCLAYLRELRVSSPMYTVLSLLSRLLFSQDTRIYVETNLGLEEEAGYKAIMQYLVPPTYAESNSLPNFSLILNYETVSISSLVEDSLSDVGTFAHNVNEFDVRRNRLVNTLRERRLWEYKADVADKRMLPKSSSPAALMQERRHRAPRHFTLTMYADWQRTRFVQDILASAIPEVSDLRLVVYNEHGEEDSSSDDSDDWDIETIIRRKNTANKVHKWGAIGDALLPESWMPVERLQVERYAIPGFAKALLAIPDDPSKVLPIIRDLRSLDIRGIRYVLQPHTRLLEGLQRRTAVLGPLVQLSVEDEDLWREEILDGHVETLETCVQPGGLRIRTLCDALVEQELNWDASVKYPK